VTSPGGGVNLAVADFNHDGRSDVAVISTDNTVSVRLSNGDGTFTRSATLKGAQGELYGLYAADVNGDGTPDIRALGAGRLLSVTPGGWWDTYTGIVHTTWWLGKGDGTFGPPTMKTKSTQSVPGGWPPLEFSIPRNTYADFNGDGIADIASLNSSIINEATAIDLQFGNANGTWEAPTETYTAGANPGAIASGDFNGDGWMDLIVVNSLYSSTPTLSVLLNDGNW
jgi:hypothetical protein